MGLLGCKSRFGQVVSGAGVHVRSGGGRARTRILAPRRPNRVGARRTPIAPLVCASLVLCELTQARPAHSLDQYATYRDPLRRPRPPNDLGRFYQDSSFGVAPGHLASTERPRGDVVILRDSDFGVPHVYGSTRAGTEFGAGYAAAEDRLFMMDALRHAGRGQLAGFAGGSPANLAMDQSVFTDAPYTEADHQRQVDRLRQLYGVDGQQPVDDATSYRPTYQHAVEIAGHRPR